MADEFTYVPSYSSDASEECAVYETKYGDGYIQAVAAGINNISEKWNLVFQKRSATEIGNLLTFLRGKNGITAFTWTPPGASTTNHYRCKAWKVVPEEADYSTLSCLFEKVNQA